MGSIGTGVLKEEGNTSPPLKGATRVSKCKYWCFTVFGFTKIEVARFLALENAETKFVLGTEICPKTKREHVQGFLQHPIAIRPMERKGYKNLKAHWERAKGSTGANIAYCSKDGDFINNGVVLPYMKECEVIAHMRDLELFNEVSIRKEIYKLMIKMNRIKPIKNSIKQKEYVDFIVEKVQDNDDFNWGENNTNYDVLDFVRL